MNEGRAKKLRRRASWAALFALSTAAALQLSACAPRMDDINKVQPGYVRKSIFQTGDEWYYRRTVAKSETTNSYVVEGSGDGYMTRVKFEIQEDYLLARKAYEGIPGSSDQEQRGSKLFEGTVIAAWPITSHFDIQRGYDPATGNTTNTISENTSDRPWTERAYMRVDWSNNLVQDNPFAGNPAWDMMPVSWVSNGSSWTNLQTSPTDIYASRFSDDYIEIGEHVLLGMDINTCAAWVGFFYSGYTHCGYGEAELRHAFLRIKKPSDFIPRDYPDSVIQTDDDGKPKIDEQTGAIKREGIFNRFGFFRVSLPVWDRRYGYLESQRLYRATIHNLWEQHKDDNGQLIPYPQRTPKPIIYYLNAEYPARWRDIALTQVAGEYNKVFSELVADLQGVDRSEVPDMFQVRVNDCNEENIIRFVNIHGGLRDAIKRGVCPGDKGNCDTPVDTDAQLAAAIGVGNLKKVCTSLEAATLDPATGVSTFQWQRIGDPRYKMIVWFNNPQESGWGGLGMMHADARTGEIISSTAYLRPHYYEMGSANVVDYVGFMLGELDVPSVIYGKTIQKQMAGTEKRYRAMTQNLPGAAFLAKLDQRMDATGATREERLVRTTGDPQLDRLKMVEGTSAAAKTIHNDDIYFASFDLGGWKPGQKVPDGAMAKASLYGRAIDRNPEAAKRARLWSTLGASGMCFLAHQFDPHWAGFAEELKDKPRDERYEYIFSRMFTHVTLHELGHNLGLRHNYEGTYDALNYDDTFWKLHCVKGLDADDCNTADLVDARQKAGYDQWRNTSVMEYTSSKGAFSNYLGKYDIAALRFGYAEQVQVFTNPAMTAKAGEDLRAWRYLNDYQSIPAHLCGKDDSTETCADKATARAVITDRKWVAFDPKNPPEKEVPFLFCSDEYRSRTPFCRAFDFGSSVSEIFANYYVGWRDYYYFNNFVRDRLSPLAWSPRRAMFGVWSALGYAQQVAHYYYMLDTVQPGFRDSAVRKDMANTLGRAINYIGEVVSTPEPGRMCRRGTKPGQDWYWGFSFCDGQTALDSDVAKEYGLIDVPIGAGRPVGIGFTTGYDDYSIAFVGSYYDKTDSLYWAGRAQPTMLRFNYELDLHNYRVGLYTLFGPEIRTLYRKVVNQPMSILSSDNSLEKASKTLGAYWCSEDPDHPGVNGYVEPRRLVDIETGELHPGASAQCQNPSSIYPNILSNSGYSAMIYAHAFLSSRLDRSKDLSKALKVYVVGAEDAYPDWDNFPACAPTINRADPNCHCDYVDSVTKVTYRSAHIQGEDSIGCALMATVKDAEDQFNIQLRNPRYRDIWRAWVERLDTARELNMIFQDI